MRDEEREDAAGEGPGAQSEEPPVPAEEPAAGAPTEPPAGEGPGEEGSTPTGDPIPGAEEASPPTGDAAPVAEEGEAEPPPTGPPLTEPPPEEARRPARPPREPAESAEEVIPGAHLEPDLVLETASDEGSEESEYARYIEVEEPADPEQALEAEAAPAEGDAEGTEPAARGPLDLARDARYRATGKRKTSVARVILRPGSGDYRLNGRPLEEFFPRPALQKRAREALDVVGYSSRMDVVARLHGGGVSSQAGALRHGIARALVEADPSLRRDLKRRGFLTRDAREKERRKAGLRKARKRPQFSKR